MSAPLATGAVFVLGQARPSILPPSEAGTPKGKGPTALRQWGSFQNHRRSKTPETTFLELHLKPEVEVPGEPQEDLGVVGVVVFVEAVVR